MTHRSTTQPRSTGHDLPGRIGIHADDFGLTAGINATIGECIDAGCLDGASVIVNGTAFAEALAVCRARPGLRTALHVNLIEGRPVADPASIPLLVRADGRLCRDFVALWRLSRGRATGAELAVQVEREIRAQTERFVEAWGGGPFSVDSHQHTHMLPAVLRALIAVCRDFDVERVRLPCEPLWLVRRTMPLGTLLGSGLVKNRILMHLSRRARPLLEDAGLAFNELFLGIVGTGRMRAEYARRAAAVLDDLPGDGALEILFHPGEAGHDELSAWSDRPSLRAYYSHSERRRERRELLQLAQRS